MLKLCPRSVLAVTALLLTLMSSSALAARGLRHETKRAAHAQRSRRRHRSHHRRPGHGPSGIAGHGAVVFRAASTSTTTIAALLGDESVEPNRDWLSGGQAEAFPFQAHTSGSTGAAHVYIDSNNTATTLIVGLYANASNQPGALLSTGSLSSPEAGAWNTATIAPVPLVSGTTYWLAVLGTGGTLHYRDHAHGTCTALTSSQTSLHALATSWSTYKAYTTCPVSAYLTAATETFPVDPPGPVELTSPTDPAPPVESTSPTEPSPPPPPAAPANNTLPTIGGTATEGQLLTATTGIWTGSPTSYSYQWQDCNSAGASCASIAGATAPSYALASADVGHRVVVVVLARNAGGSSSATSAPTAIVAADPPPPPPPPSAPANSSAPSIGGSAVLGGVLSSTTGTWTGSPTSYSYQWQDCNSTGTGCANVSGATASTHALGSGDVGHTVRVVVTAANAGGEAPATSATIGPVSAPPPTASFTYSPSAPATGQQVTLNDTSSTCPDGPCAYEWSDDGSTTRPIPSLWPLGSGQTLLYTFSGAGTKYIRLVVTDAAGQEATVEHNVTVAGKVEENPPPPPPPPVAPTNTAPPKVSGTAQVGQTLSATSGTWSGTAPIAYSYQWEDCNAAGAACVDIAGAASATYTPGSGDEGHTLRIVETASNEGGSAAATSAQTAAVAASGETRTNCFSKPSECGYPDSTNTGVPPGSTLTPSGEIVVTTNGAVISRKDVTGSIQVQANNVVIKETEVTVDGTQKCPADTKPCGGYGIRVYEGYTGTVITHDTIHGGAEEGENALQNCVNNEGGETTTVTYTYAYHCTFGHGSGVWEDNYSLLNLTIPELHYDNFIDDGYTGKLVLRHNTFFNPHEQTSEILLQDQFGDINEAVVEDNLLAGGGYMIYGGEGAHTEEYAVNGPVIVRDNRFARCTGTSESTDNGKICKGLAFGATDGHGFYPRGGFYGAFAHFDEAVSTFSGNYWDNDLEALTP